MNKTFLKTQKIDLDSNWHLTPDGFNGITLTFHEIRQKTKKGTEEKEDFEFTDSFFYPRIAQALTKYIDATQNNSETLQEILDKTDKLNKLVEKLDKEFKQF